MNIDTPKYSIIIPTYNGVKYLPTCIESITSQEYSDYELIISDDHSTDETREFLATLNHTNIRIIYPPTSLSMTEHWEWALSHAKGEWQIFVGQDDGLQSYFFQLADRLTKIAKKKGLRTITSSRAYFFWRGCEHVYGNIAIGYAAKNKVKIANIKYGALKALLGLKVYFDLPQMYTTSLFHKELLLEAMAKQNGQVFSCHPQDANLAAISCSLEEKYLKSYIPMGWVGSSPKSAGMAISGATSSFLNKRMAEDSEILKKDYLQKVSKSKLKYHKWAGDFSFGSIALYFWQALLMTPNLRTTKINNLIRANMFKTLLFSCVLYEKKFPQNKRKKSLVQLNEFNELLQINGCSKYRVYFMFMIISPFAKSISFFMRVVRKLVNIFTTNKIKRNIVWNDNDDINMIVESKKIYDELKLKRWF